MAGKLFVVATPIGNREDITFRAVKILGEADRIAAEDTRHSGMLLKYLDIHKPMISLHEHNELSRTDAIAGYLDQGENIALITDAGTPGLSDPGAVLVGELRQRGYEIIPIPGASALAAAISVAGLMDSRFAFEGFLPASGKGRRQRLQALAEEKRAVFLYEAPHRLQSTLQDLLQAMGDRNITIFRELTKLYEQILTMPLSEAIGFFPAPKGEFVLMLEAAQEAEADIAGAQAEMANLLGEGMSRKDAAAKIAREFGLPKNTVYGWDL